jgi:hypothetical protein
MCRSFRQRLAVQDDVRAPCCRACHFRVWRKLRHHNRRPNIAEVCVPRHRLRMIAGRHRDDAALAFRVGEQRKPVCGAAFLKSAGYL